MRRARPHLAGFTGFTILELMVVIAILGVTVYALRSGYRSLTQASLGEASTELTSFLRRVGVLAVETGEQHRVVFDLETGKYVAEVCHGQATLARDAKLRPDAEEVEEAAARGKQRLQDLPSDALAVGDPDEATRRALAIAGHHVADRTCTPVGETYDSGLSRKAHNDERKHWERQLGEDLKLKEIWVQHRDDSTTKGQIAVYFFPNGSAEKAVIELADGDSVQSILVHALTGRIQHVSHELEDIDEHMLRNALGDREREREVRR